MSVASSEARRLEDLLNLEHECSCLGININGLTKNKACLYFDKLDHGLVDSVLGLKLKRSRALTQSIPTAAWIISHDSTIAYLLFF